MKAVHKLESVRRRLVKAAIEGLESRRLFTTFVVMNTSDTGAGSLRDAITQLNASTDAANTINFHIPGTGLQTISPATALPAITKAVTIDGYSQPGASPGSLVSATKIDVAIDGVNAGDASGLTVNAKNVTIDGLAIYRFGGTSNSSGDGIDLTDGSGHDAVWGNFIGISTDGTTAMPNSEGIYVSQGSSNNTIGGTDVADRNTISGNQYDGVAILYALGSGLQVTGNVVEGNYIGTDATGQTAVANGQDGVRIFRSSDTTVGGTADGAGNLISGNTIDGVDSEFGQDATVQGNFIGTDVSGTKALGNGRDGVQILDESGDLVGGTTAGARNLISGNGQNGIDTTADETAIEGNYIGTDITGANALGNKKDGIFSADFNGLVGGTAAGAGNLVSGNVNGVELTEVAQGNAIKGNTIGTDVTGTKALGNTGAGILIDDGSFDNTVGGTDVDAGNLISGNGTFGVAVDGTGDDSTANGAHDTTDNAIEGNLIGTDITGTHGLGDGNAGVYVDLGAERTTIGGTTAAARNIISGIAGAGVYIAGTHINYSGGTGQATLTNSTTIEGNYIGTDITGTKRVAAPYNASMLQGGGAGVYLDTGTSDNLVGGTTAAARNVIAGNAGPGVAIVDYASSNTVEGNYIGVDMTGLNSLGNGLSGVEIGGGCESNVIGGLTPGVRNVISANGTVAASAGVVLVGGAGYDGYNTTGENVVAGNYIGTDATGALPLGNTGAGVSILFDASNNTIGGTVAAAGNLIANNGGAGVSVVRFSSTADTASEKSNGNTIRFNSIYHNAGLGIDLENNGRTPNDPQDTDTGGNNLQNFPVLVTSASTGSSLTVNGMFNSVPSSTFTLDFYVNDTIDAHGNSQGKQYVGSIGVVTDGSGNATFSGTFNVAIGSNKYITATATNYTTAPYGDTSEFSQAVEATVTTPVTPPPPPPSPPAISVANASTTEGNSGTKVLTFTVKLSAAAVGAVTVNYATKDGTAKTSDADYLATAGTLTFTAGQTSKTVSVTLKGDTKVEADESFDLVLSSPTNATLANTYAVGTIKNDDAAPVLPKLSIGGYTAVEGASGKKAFTFKVTLDKSGTSAIKVNYATQAGTASSGSDYTGVSGTLTFAAGETSKMITVYVVGDKAKEADELFYVLLSSPTNATISVAKATGKIVNDD